MLSSLRHSAKVANHAWLAAAGKSFSASAAEAESVMQSAVSDAHRQEPSFLGAPNNRLLMGPGPSNPYPRSLAAMSAPIIGHMHRNCFEVQDEVQEGLKYVFQTDSPYVFGLSASGGAAMETAVSNLLEPGEKAVVGVTGIWGDRVAEMVRRHGSTAVEITKNPGKTVCFDTIEQHLEEHKPQLLFLCHGESSSGTKQNLAGVGELCKKHNTLLLVDTVCTLAGEPFYADEWGIDCVYSGAQKCLGAPPGLSPMMFSERAMEKVKSRKSKCDIYNFDLLEVGKQWGWYGEGMVRPYHHTPPVHNLYAMRESLNIVAEEGLAAGWERHAEMHKMLWEGLTKLGLEPFVKDPNDRLSTVNCIKIPEGVDGAKLSAYAMSKYEVEIAGGLGPTAGKIWRIGLMGHNCTPRNVNIVLSTFEDGLKQQNFL